MDPIASSDEAKKKAPNRLLATRNLWPILPVSLVASLLYFEGLFRNKSLMYGDAIIHGYPVLSYHKAVLEGHASLLWSNLIYGGHPLHAEGQFSFFSPLNTAVAYLLPPDLGQNVYHWLCLILTGLGMIALCRRLALSNIATAFAALAVPFSSMWLGSAVNIAISGSLALIPWALWSFEKWLSDPSQYLALAIVMALMVFSGYPQTLHGTAIYMTVSLVGVFMTAESRRTTRQHWKAYIGYGLAAVIICIGISAVQLIPTLELVSLSHRRSGTGIPFVISPSFGYRGLLCNPEKSYFPILGSLLVCVLASTIILYKLSARNVGHLVAAALLFSLGLGLGSPIFRMLYYSSVPLGLEYFRVSSTYFAMAIIGISVIAAAAIDNFESIDFRQTGTKLKLLGLLYFWITVLTKYSISDAPLIQTFVAVIALGGAVSFAIYSVRQYLGPLVLALLVAEILLVKFQMLVFHDNDLLKTPPSVTFVKNQNNYSDFKWSDLSGAAGLAFAGPPTPGLDANMLRMINSIAGSSNLLWNIPSIRGAHALPLARRVLIEDRMKKDINVTSEGRSGLRLIDYLGIKYIAVKDYTGGEAMQPAYQDKLHGIKIQSNTSARPRFQTFTDYQWVESAEEAAATIGGLDSKVLVLEHLGDITDFRNFPKPAPERNATSNGLEFVTEEATSSYYKFSVSAKNPGFFFIADANYPGWKAKIDGNPTEVFSAQVLGKAVMLPEGNHTLEVYFQSDSFRLGLVLSIVALLFATVLGLKKWCGRVRSGSKKYSGLLPL